MTLLRTTFLRNAPRSIARTTITPTLRQTTVRFASSDYGSGAGDPKGSDPQAQGPNPSASKEHPGPPPPKAGQGSGSTPTKGTSDGHNTGEAVQGGGSGGGGSSGQKKSFSTMTKWAKEGDKSKEVRGAEPKILNEKAPEEHEQSKDVKEHNKDMDQRAEQAHEKVDDKEIEKDKVDKGFWAGQGGRDRDP